MSHEAIAGMVSVVIPTRNRPVLLRRAMQSVLAQGWRNLELIVVDDASDPAQDVAAVVAAIAAIDDRVQFLLQPRQMGVSAARNRGIAHARGAYIAFQDDDDEWLADKLVRQVSLLEEMGDTYVMVGGSVMRCSTGAAPKVMGWPRLPNDATVDDTGFVNGVCAFLQTALMRAGSLRAIGGFDETIMISEDWELCLRLREQGRFAAISDPVVVSHESPTGLLSRLDLRVSSYGALLEKHAKGLLKPFPRAVSTLSYETAKACSLLERRGDALAYAIKAIGLEPWRVKYWLSIPVLLAGPMLTRSIMRIRRRMLRAIGRNP